MSQQTAPSHTAPSGLDELIRIAEAQPLSPACDHFYFLRHGQTGRNALRIFQAVDEPLSELGLQQAARAAGLLAGEPISTVVCSDARRAHDTAYTVATTLKLMPAAQAALRERNFGALIGTSSANIDWACEPEGGETLTQFVARTRDALDTALRLPAPVLVVAHGGTLYALAALLGVPVDVGLLGNAQPLRFERHGPTWAVTPLLRQADGDAALA
jgi:probable phosphoglycerate mutase